MHHAFTQNVYVQQTDLRQDWTCFVLINISDSVAGPVAQDDALLPPLNKTAEMSALVLTGAAVSRVEHRAASLQIP